MIRQPEILLLDEATSALDPENQEVVGRYIDEKMSGKTMLSITHRIETVKGVDKMYLI